jgi:hypothetical protein
MTDACDIAADRLEILVLARLATWPKKQRASLAPRRKRRSSQHSMTSTSGRADEPTAVGPLASTLHNIAPAIEEPRWRELIAAMLRHLQGRQLVTSDYRVADAEELTRRIGPHKARTWDQWSQRLLPALALGIPSDDVAALKRIDGRDGWCTAVAARVLDLWTDGPPRTPAALGDALVTRELGLSGAARRCPPWLRGHFLRKHVTVDHGASAEQLIRMLAVRAIGAPNASLHAIYSGLVRLWLAGRRVGAPVDIAPTDALVDAVRTVA